LGTFFINIFFKKPGVENTKIQPVINHRMSIETQMIPFHNCLVKSAGLSDGFRELCINQGRQRDFLQKISIADAFADHTGDNR
jgi:hypothetical protein